jgi:hypothetical protein
LGVSVTLEAGVSAFGGLPARPGDFERPGDLDRALLGDLFRAPLTGDLEVSFTHQCKILKLNASFKANSFASSRKKP